MAKKELKKTAIFGGKQYIRDNLSGYYSNKEDAIKRANKLKSKGLNVVRDKNSRGHFLWIGVKKYKSKPKAKMRGRLPDISAIPSKPKKTDILKYKPKAKFKSTTDSKIVIIQKKIKELKTEIEQDKTGYAYEYAKKEERRYDKLANEATDIKNMRYYDKEAKRVRNQFWSDINKKEKKIKNYKNKIEEHKLGFNKVNKLIKENFSRESKWRKGRIGGSYSTGYVIEKPTHEDPKIKIRWNSYQFASPEIEQKDIKEFKDKIKPILKANNVKFTEEKRYIIIQ